jgi:hypothetical protein
MENLTNYSRVRRRTERGKWKTIDTSGVRKNRMHELLKIPEGDKNIDSVYKSGKKLAEDLVAALKKEKDVPEKDVRAKAVQMLLFAGNWPKTDSKNSVFDVAARHVKSLF